MKGITNVAESLLSRRGCNQSAEALNRALYLGSLPAVDRPTIDPRRTPRHAKDKQTAGEALGHVETSMSPGVHILAPGVHRVSPQPLVSVPGQRQRQQQMLGP
ncbi:unnamed protein product [Arctogadus glacialis]